MKLLDKIKGFESGGADQKATYYGWRTRCSYFPNQTGQITQSARGTGGGQ
ncbi:MAG: hypothetical protein CM15mV87_400 [Caudoviricetes sp.]|nr:MAG: hypothetical protein CM15mV87_400 [Caudoviricetes sp.]